MDREIAQDVRTRRTVKRVAGVLIGVAAVVFLLAATLQWLRPSIGRDEVRIATVERGPIDASLQASGTVIPAGEQAISSPVEARVLRIVRRAGDRVKRGDELLALDTAATRLEVDRAEERLAQKESAGAQLRLQLDDKRATLAAQIESKKLDVEILRLKAASHAKLLKEGLVSDQDANASRAEARKSEIELAQLQEALQRNLRSAAAQLGASEMETNMVRRERAESQRQLDLAMTRANRDGVVTWVLPEEGATVQRGQVVARIADLSAFRVVAQIADMYVPRIAPGMPVRLRSDRDVITGSIASIDPRIEGGVAKFYVDLDSPSDARLRNNIRLDVFVITGRRPEALRVSRGSLGDGQRATLFVVRGKRLVATPVRLGLAGDEWVEIASGLAAGDQVVISDMADYNGLKELRLK